MKSIASASGGWCVEADMMLCEGHTLKVFPSIYGSSPLEHQLPTLVQFRDILEDMNRCTSLVYILPERDCTNEERL